MGISVHLMEKTAYPVQIFESLIRLNGINTAIDE